MDKVNCFYSPNNKVRLSVSYRPQQLLGRIDGVKSSYVISSEMRFHRSRHDGRPRPLFQLSPHRQT
ncbi:MAG: hypothetical protein LZF86_100004 [Nitrospira sp.]|nr:MAG: hypothetical protein LZF86_100004 [Nitrospira sp.]